MIYFLGFVRFHLLFDNFHETSYVGIPGFTVYYVTRHLHFLLPGIGCMTNLDFFKTILLTSCEKRRLSGSMSSSMILCEYWLGALGEIFSPVPKIFLLSVSVFFFFFFSLPPGDISFLGFLFLRFSDLTSHSDWHQTISLVLDRYK